MVLVSVLLVSCATAPANAQADEPAISVVTRNADDEVSIQYQNGAAQIDIYSPSGIGSAAFALESGVMPGKIILRLHLGGLEQVQLKSPHEAIRASVSSDGTFSVGEQTILSAGTESSLLPGNPLWMEIDVVSAQAEKKIPLKEGYFEVMIPGTFLQNAGTSFEVEWIDFFR
jgi:hypothetical protein